MMMNLIPVFTKDRRVVWIDLKKDLIGIRVIGGKTEIITDDGIYYPIGPSIDDYEILLDPYTFKRVDRGGIANLDKIIDMDDKRRYIYFETTGGKDFFTVSMYRYNELKHKFYEIINKKKKQS